MRSFNRNIILVLILLLVAGGCKPKKKELSDEQIKETKKHLVNVNKTLVKKDQKKISGYIKRHNLNMTETPTGLWYSIEKKGEGVKAEEGLLATINYKVYLLQGTECYSSDKSGLKTFLIGRGGVETGLEEGILLLNEGARAKFIMPPHLAHGLPGDGDKIPARAIIVYDVELIKLSQE